MKNLYYLMANSPWGQFGDYFWAPSRVVAELMFQNRHHVWPTSARIERRGRRVA